MSNNYRTVKDATDKPRQPGTGHLITRWCLGCDSKRETPGSRGVGLRWRCATCVKTRNAA